MLPKTWVRTDPWGGLWIYWLFPKTKNLWIRGMPQRIGQTDPQPNLKFTVLGPLGSVEIPVGEFSKEGYKMRNIFG